MSYRDTNFTQIDWDRSMFRKFIKSVRPIQARSHKDCPLQNKLFLPDGYSSVFIIYRCIDGKLIEFFHFFFFCMKVFREIFKKRYHERVKMLFFFAQYCWQTHESIVTLLNNCLCPDELNLFYFLGKIISMKINGGVWNGLHTRSQIR